MLLLKHILFVKYKKLFIKIKNYIYTGLWVYNKLLVFFHHLNNLAKALIINYISITNTWNWKSKIMSVQLILIVVFILFLAFLILKRLIKLLFFVLFLFVIYLVYIYISGGDVNKEVNKVKSKAEKIYNK